MAHHPHDGHPPRVHIKLTTFHRIVITFPSTVTHHLKEGQLDFEFDSSSAKLVNLVVILAQLVSSSVALPAQLVSCVGNPTSLPTDLYMLRLPLKLD